MELSMEMAEAIKKMREMASIFIRNLLLHSSEHTSFEVHLRMPAAFVTEELHLMNSSRICNYQSHYLLFLHGRK